MGTAASRFLTKVSRALVGFGLIVRTSTTSVLSSDPTITAGSAAPSESEPNGSLYLRTNGRSYTRVGSAWRDDKIQRTLVTITAAQLRALRATPVTLLAAPGSGKFIEHVSSHWWMDYGTVAHSAPSNAGDDIGLRYTDGSGAVVATLEANGFIDGSSDQHRMVTGGAATPTSAQSLAPVSNAALVAHNVGAAEFSGTGDGVLKVELFFRIRDLEPA